MSRARFELALERLRGGDWERFESFASEFLVSEFNSLRTTASPSGDRGRDSYLFRPKDDVTTLLQYSVTKFWDRKVKDTLVRITEEFSNARVLIYVTCQSIGAEADDLKGLAQKKYKLHLDVRDRSWFLDRQFSNTHREIAAENLAREIVDPLLEHRGINQGRAPALSETEQKAAFLYLGLQWEDDDRDKGLTKTTFDALVRSVLRNTSATTRMSSSELFAQVRRLLPTHSSEQVDTRTRSALNRLTKRYIRHHTKEDEYCLTHEEVKRVNEQLVLVEMEDGRLDDTVIDVTSKYLVDSDALQGLSKMTIQPSDVATRVRRVLDQFLLNSGEAFAIAVMEGSYRQLGFNDLNNLVLNDLEKHPAPKKDLTAAVIAAIADIVQEILVNPGEATQKYLRRLADSYTLFAFLQSTPDVQAAVAKMFSHGKIWLDTNIILPLFVEEDLESEQRRFTNMIKLARKAGLKLLLTNGILEEIEGHFKRSSACASCVIDRWVGQIPFLYSKYIESGRSPSQFDKWTENFLGNSRPRDDLRDYLQQEHEVQILDLAELAQKAPAELRDAVTEIWYKRREGRISSAGRDVDTNRLRLLVEHDVENYVGIIERRKHEAPSMFGYSSWLLTLDRTAFRVHNELKTWLTSKVPDSPILSADFLINYLAFGPNRMAVPKEREFTLPVALGLGAMTNLPEELLLLASRIREEAAGIPDRVIRRKIRDGIDKAKRRLGRTALRGHESLEHELLG